ncbi:thiosulfate oxidation carrier complex protein SoxZ [uncultured Amphritea sp.]|uniref:thiosulfate oxidation carrier complex protein SoxZ n=1 Tax=uncultured Amphritea sp. TaxID=981605 RepID=UPI002620E232|nr:thiosulfate oxidation carrier complex protein SoxZ [uncultured Amphritea sp.]
MADIMKVNAEVRSDMTVVKLMLKHVMETGLRENTETGKRIPAKFLREITVTHGDKTVFAANLGTGIAKNPFFSFSFFGGAKGDLLTITWLENTGKSGSETATIK